MRQLYCNRSKQCHCCGEKVRVHIRIGLRIGDYEDPDYVVAFCPNCDIRNDVIVSPLG